MKTKKYILPLIFALLLTFTLVGNCAWLSGYDQRIKLTIDNSKIDSALSDFPVTVFFTSTQAEEIFTEFDADSDYMKCAFTSSDGTTQLYAEKELFDVSDYTSQYPPAQSDTYAKSTTKYSTDYWAYYATDPLLSVTGGGAANSWISEDTVITNQRFHIDLGSAKIIRRIYYENYHTVGTKTNVGVKNFTFWGSNTAGSFAELTYGTDTGWTQLTCSQNTFDQHVDSDVADPKYITVTNSTAYRYYAFKFADGYGSTQAIGFRRIELQTQDLKAIYHVKVTSVSSSVDTDIYYYYDNDASDNTTYIGAINTTAGGHVWDSNFKAVYHMTDATTSTVVDSTSNSNDGTKKAANEPIEATGKVGQAQDFDGTDDVIDINGSSGSGHDLDFIDTEAFTICTCFKTSSNGTLVSKRDGVLDQYQFYINNGKLMFRAGGEYGRVENIVTDDAWHFGVVVIDSSGNPEIYLDGEKKTWVNEVGTKPFSFTHRDVDVSIGARWDSYPTTGFLFDGIIDEVSILNTARSDAWIKATYNSLWDSLVSYGSEETGGVVDNAVMFGINF